MKKRMRSLCCVALLTSLTAYPGFASAQNRPSPERRTLPEGVLAYLKRMEPKATFRGAVITIPEDLKDSLELGFYLHRFIIVRMERNLGIGKMESEMIVVTDAKSGEVVSSLWELGVGGTPESFKELLTKYPETYDWRGMAGRIKVLSDLLVYPDRDYGKPMGGRVGSFRYDSKGKAIEAELIRVYKPYRLLRVAVEEKDDRYKLGRLSLIDPETGREQ